MPGHGLQVSNVTLLGEITDLVIVVGGDGSLLGAARFGKVQHARTGYQSWSFRILTDISPDDSMCDEVQAVLDGHYISELRFAGRRGAPRWQSDCYGFGLK